MRSPRLAAQSSAVYLFLLAALFIMLPFHLRPDNFIVDDGYFYPQIARYIARGNGSTFNGLIPTNGYHPLWMIVCVVVAWFTSSSSILVQILSLLQDALILGSLAALLAMARASKMQGALIGWAPILFLNVVLGIWRLLESPLALALQMSVLVVLLPVLPVVYEKTERWRDTLLGTLLGFTMLARLDLAFFVLVVLLYGFFENSSFGRRGKHVLIRGSIAALVVAPYLAWNVVNFHHLVPISGAIKSTFPHVQHWAIAVFMYPVVGGVLINCVLVLKRIKTGFDAMCLLTAIAALLHMAYSLSFGELAPWYLTTGYLTASLALTWVANSILQRAPSFAWIEQGITSLMFVVFLLLASLRLYSNFSYTRLMQHDVSFHRAYEEPKHALALRLKASLPAGSRILTFDAPGGIAFYSSMSIIPVDGLVSDYAYNFQIVKEGFASYAARNKIDFMIAPYLQVGQTYDRLSLRGERIAVGQVMSISAPLTRKPAGTVTLANEDLLFRFQDPNPGLEDVYPEIGVWRLRH